MSLDIASSTEIAEGRGSVRFHALLNRLFYETAGAVPQPVGEIYEYVGHEVIIFWQKAKGLSTAIACVVFF